METIRNDQQVHFHCFFNFRFNVGAGQSNLEASRFSNDTIAITPENLALLQRYSKKNAEIEVIEKKEKK
ncbi:hypothetical protein GCM10028804_51680 [Larkinella terrae]